MRVSVVIPTRNRADTLKTCLEALKQQTLSPNAFELIVVDNGSEDHTAKIVESFSNSLQLVYSYKEEPGLHVGRHEGLRLARSNLLVFVDDDIEAHACWLEAIYENFNDPTVALVGGNNYPTFEDNPPEWLNTLWARSIYKGQVLGSLSISDFGEGHFEIDPGYIWGCNFSIRRDVLVQAGGFHPDGVPKDRLRFRGDGETHVSNYVRTSGMKAMFDSNVSVHHLVSRDRMTKDYFCQRYFAQGISDSYSAIRAAGRIPGYRKRLGNLAQSVKVQLRNAKSLLYVNEPVETELANIMNSAQRAYWKGYRFHIREALNDPSLLDWILRRNYF